MSTYCRALLFLGVTTLGFSKPPLAAQQVESINVADLVQRTTRSVALVVVERPDGAGQGSAFVVDPAGLLLTNRHVIAGASSVVVKLPSGDVFDHVELMAEDIRRDIAVLRVHGFGLPAVELANSDAVRVGANVVVIGSPLGLENTVSAGLVSGRRAIEGHELLQISAAISPGSSGGPVFGPDGRVIGIAVAQIAGGQNLNFAVPINYARGLLTHLPSEPVTTYTPAGMTLASGGEQYGDFIFAKRTDEMTDRDASYIMTVDTSEGDTNPFLLWGCDDGELELLINAGTFLSTEPTMVEYRFDSEKMQRSRWGTSTNGQAVYPLEGIFLRHMTRNAKKAQRIRVRVYDYQGTTYMFVFALAGFSEAYARLDCRLTDSQLRPYP